MFIKSYKVLKCFVYFKHRHHRLLRRSTRHLLQRVLLLRHQRPVADRDRGLVALDQLQADVVEAEQLRKIQREQLV